MKKCNRCNKTINADELHCWFSTVADFLSEIMSTSVKELTQVNLSLLYYSLWPQTMIPVAILQ